MAKKTDEDSLVKLSVLVEAEVALRLKITAAERATTMRAAVREAVVAWIETPPRRRRTR